MKNWKAFVFFLLCGPILTACGDSKDAATIYVLVPPRNAPRFTRDLAVIAKHHGLKPDLGRSVGRSHVYWVVEADGHWLHLWSTNVPLSGYENPSLCGHYAEGHPDPGQYYVTVDHGLVKLGLNHVLAKMAPGTPHALMVEISKDLTASGYVVRKTPALCSPLSKTQAPS